MTKENLETELFETQTSYGIGRRTFCKGGLAVVGGGILAGLIPYANAAEKVVASLPPIKRLDEVIRQRTQLRALFGNNYAAASAYLSSTDPPQQCFFYTEEITVPLVPDPIDYSNAERSENAWNYALSRDLTPAEKKDEGGSGKFWIMYNTNPDSEYLNIFVDNYSSRKFGTGNSIFCNIGLDTRADGRTCPPSEDDFAIQVVRNASDFRTRVWGYPNDKAVPFLNEVRCYINLPKKKNDFVRYKIGIPLKILRYYQDSALLKKVGIRIGVFGSDKNRISFPPSTEQYGDDTIAYSYWSEIPIPEFPGWIAAGALAGGLGYALYETSKIKRNNSA